MAKFNVGAGSHKGKRIDVTSFKATASGVEIKILHNLSTTMGKSLRWVQTVAENGSFFRRCRLKAYVDPWSPSGKADPITKKEICSADDKKPFYWTDSEFSGGQGPGFYDRPAESAPKKGVTWIRFVTSLGEVSGTDVTTLVSIVWGFDVSSKGKVTAKLPRAATGQESLGHRSILKRMYPKYTFKGVK